MAKSKSAYFCQSCGYESPKWLGQCPSCKQWNTFVEEVVEKASSRVPEWRSTNTSPGVQKRTNKAAVIHEIVYSEEQRMLSPDKEFNRVLGGGIVPGSLVLIGGEPGIGKSTLMLQLALSIPKVKTLYISGEESEQQIKMRAERLQQNSNANCYILTETSMQNIFKQIDQVEPNV
ncbi:AAA family ATPase, partial [Sphingobacterium cellulitidis]